MIRQIPETSLIEIIKLDAAGKTRREIADFYKISPQALNARIKRNRELYDHMKSQYLAGFAFQHGMNDAQKNS